MEILKHISENDYEFQSQPNGYHSCWITIKNLSVYIVKTDEGIMLEVYPLGREYDEALISTYVFFNEANDMEEQREKEQEEI